MAMGQHATGQGDRAVLGDLVDRVLGGARRPPEPHLHPGLAGLDVEIARRTEHVPPIAGGEHQVIEGARRVEEGGDRGLVPDIHGLTRGAPTERLGGDLGAGAPT